MEGYLRHLASSQQDNWADWLAVATAVHNHHSNATTKLAPTEVLMGYHPCLDHQGPPSMNDWAEECTKRAYVAREMARAAINHWVGQTPPSQFKTGDQVWLEAKNLTLPYASIKLAPRRHGPFSIIKQVSPSPTNSPSLHPGLSTMSSTPPYFLHIITCRSMDRTSLVPRLR